MCRSRTFCCAIFRTPVTSLQTFTFKAITRLGDVTVKLSLHLTCSELSVLRHGFHRSTRSSQQRRVVLIWRRPRCYNQGSSMTSLSTIKRGRPWTADPGGQRRPGWLLSYVYMYVCTRIHISNKQFLARLFKYIACFIDILVRTSQPTKYHF